MTFTDKEMRMIANAVRQVIVDERARPDVAAHDHTDTVEDFKSLHFKLSNRP